MRLYPWNNQSSRLQKYLSYRGEFLARERDEIRAVPDTIGILLTHVHSHMQAQGWTTAGVARSLQRNRQTGSTRHRRSWRTFEHIYTYTHCTHTHTYTCLPLHRCARMRRCPICATRVSPESLFSPASAAHVLTFC